jgi:hypothetical protein
LYWRDIGVKLLKKEKEMEMKFKELSGIIIREFPYPIASLFLKYNKIEANSYQIKHSQLCDIFEASIKLIAIVLMKELVAKNKLGKYFPQGVEFLKHPSLGHWLSIIREISKDKESDKEYWQTKIVNWLFADTSESNMRKLFQALPEIAFQKGISVNWGVLNTLVAYRNKVWKGHGVAVVAEESLARRVEAIENIFIQLFCVADFFKEMNFFYTKEVKKFDQTKYEASCISLVGVNFEAVNYVYTDFDINEIYLTAEGKNDLQIAPLLISPLVEMQNSNGNPQFYFFNDARRSKLEYLSYTDGSFYFFREIKNELEKIMKVDLKRGSTEYEEKIFNYSPEEREAKALQEYNKGIELLYTGKPESAILAFEEAIEWDRKAEYYLQMCKAMESVGDPAEYILDNLEFMFEIEANNLEAIALRNRLLNIDKKQTDDELVSADKINLSEVGINYFQWLTPRKLRNISSLFWILSVVTFYSLSTIVFLLLDPQNAIEHTIVSIIFLLVSVIIIIGMFSASNKFQDSYFSLWGQVENMKLTRFNRWFIENSRAIFGNFILIEATITDADAFKKDDLSKYSIRLNLEKEHKILVFLVIFILVFSLNNVSTQQLQNFSFWTAVLRFVNTTVYWVLIAPMIRLLIAYVTFTKEYSTLDLAPVISRLGTNGFKSLTQMFILTILLIDLFWILNWTWDLVACKDPFYTDFLGLGFALIIVMFYIFFTPFFIGRALNLSKSVVMLDYKAHIKSAFKKFVKKPATETLEELNWLILNEEKIKKISSKMYSFWQVSFIVFSILFILAISVTYILGRIDQLDIVTQFIPLRR